MSKDLNSSDSQELFVGRKKVKDNQPDRRQSQIPQYSVSCKLYQTVIFMISDMAHIHNS